MALTNYVSVLKQLDTLQLHIKAFMDISLDWDKLCPIMNVQEQAISNARVRLSIFIYLQYLEYMLQQLIEDLTL